MSTHTELVYNKPTIAPEKKTYRHVIRKGDTQWMLFCEMYTPDGKNVGRAIRECMGKRVPSDTGRMLKIIVTGNTVRCQMSRMDEKFCKHMVPYGSTCCACEKQRDHG